jgi:hypothetical protein
VSRAVLGLILAVVVGCRREPPPPADSAPDAAAAATVESTTGTHVLSDGAEPRSVVAFTFVSGRHEARVLSIESRIERGGATKVDERVELRLEVRYNSPRAIEIEVQHAETTSADVPAVASTVGAVCALSFGDDGVASKPDFRFPSSVNGTAKLHVQGALEQLTPLLLPIVPSSPIGEGARWRVGAADGPVRQLTSRNGGAVVVEQHREGHGPRRVDKRRVGEVSVDQQARLEVPLDGVARRIESISIENLANGTRDTTRLRLE